MKRPFGIHVVPHSVTITLIHYNLGLSLQFHLFLLPSLQAILCCARPYISVQLLQPSDAIFLIHCKLDLSLPFLPSILPFPQAILFCVSLFIAVQLLQPSDPIFLFQSHLGPSRPFNPSFLLSLRNNPILRQFLHLCAARTAIRRYLLSPLQSWSFSSIPPFLSSIPHKEFYPS